jgi:hypothetical protein
MIKRREFVAGLGSAVAWPVVTRAQQPDRPVFGLLPGEVISPHPPSFWLRQRLGDFAGIFNKKSRDRTKRSILESHDPYWSASL